MEVQGIQGTKSELNQVKKASFLHSERLGVRRNMRWLEKVLFTLDTINLTISSPTFSGAFLHIYFILKNQSCFVKILLGVVEWLKVKNYHLTQTGVGSNINRP